MTHTRQNFRCIAGCCICGTKSSTSRFTSSNNYEAYFGRCFLIEGRSGEICNACVLIVKRFMKNPNSGHNWHHIVDNGHNKKNRKKVSLKIRLLKNANGENFDANNWPFNPPNVPANNDPPPRNAIKYKHRTRKQRTAAKGPDSEWLLLTNPEVPNTFFRDHDPYPRLSTQHQIIPKPSKVSSLPEQSLEAHHAQHIFQNPLDQPCLARPCKQTLELREQTFLQQPGKQSGVALPTPPRYPSPVGHHCYPTPATTPDLNTSSNAATRPYTEHSSSSLSPCPSVHYQGVDDDAPYDGAHSSYMSTLNPSVPRSASSLHAGPSDSTNCLTHLCQAMILDSHSSSSLVRCPNVWQNQGQASGQSLADDSGCYDTGDSSQELMAVPCSPYNSPYPSPCPSDPIVGVEDDDSLQCLSAIVADRPRLPVPRTSFGATQYSGATSSGPSHPVSARGTCTVPGGLRCSRRKQSTPKKGARTASLALDVVTTSSYWTQKKTCCGIVNLGKNSELLLKAGQYKPSSGGHHDAMCTVALQRLSLDATVPPAEETVTESHSDSYEMMARDMAILHKRSAPTITASSMAPPIMSTASVITNKVLSSSLNPALAAISSDRASVRTTLADWNESSPQSCRQQFRPRAPLSSTHTTDNDNKMDDYHVISSMYHHDWSRFYDDDTKKQHLDQDTMIENDHSNTTYFKEVSHRNCPVVTISKVDALGALDLTKETGGWGVGPPELVN